MNISKLANGVTVILCLRYTGAYTVTRISCKKKQGSQSAKYVGSKHSSCDAAK